jgi:anti-sigma regulatory factor (Ser/Thr protein kinase)
MVVASKAAAIDQESVVVLLVAMARVTSGKASGYERQGLGLHIIPRLTGRLSYRPAGRVLVCMIIVALGRDGISGRDR